MVLKQRCLNLCGGGNSSSASSTYGRSCSSIFKQVGWPVLTKLTCLCVQMLDAHDCCLRAALSCKLLEVEPSLLLFPLVVMVSYHCM